LLTIITGWQRLGDGTRYGPRTVERSPCKRYDDAVSPEIPPPGELTSLLRAWSEGDGAALERLTPIVYAELHRIARNHLSRERDHDVLQPSALINEAFIRLMGGAPVEWADRTHFFAVFARMMRQILTDMARAQDTDKRGGRAPHFSLYDALDRPEMVTTPACFLDLDAALNDLARLNSRHAQVVELRYFGGLETSEIAAALGVSEPTVVRDWRVARAWLSSRLAPAEGGGAASGSSE